MEPAYDVSTGNIIEADTEKRDYRNTTHKLSVWCLAENADHPCPLCHYHFVYILSGGNEDPFGMEAREMADDTYQANQSEPQPLPGQFTTVFEYLINVSGFELPFILVLLDADDIVVRNKIVQNSENGNVLSATDFVCSEGADDGLSYPMHIMVRDVNGNAAYGYLDDIDAQPEIQMVHVGEDE
jgi:hypothetical protein